MVNTTAFAAGSPSATSPSSSDTSAASFDEPPNPSSGSPSSSAGAAAGLRVEPLAWGAPLPAALAGPRAPWLALAELTNVSGGGACREASLAYEVARDAARSLTGEEWPGGISATMEARLGRVKSYKRALAASERSRRACIGGALLFGLLLRSSRAGEETARFGLGKELPPSIATAGRVAWPT